MNGNDRLNIYNLSLKLNNLFENFLPGMEFFYIHKCYMLYQGTAGRQSHLRLHVFVGYIAYQLVVEMTVAVDMVVALDIAVVVETVVVVGIAVVVDTAAVAVDTAAVAVNIAVVDMEVAVLADVLVWYHYLSPFS